MPHNIFKKLFFVLLTAIIITGCGGGSSSTGGTVTPANYVTGKFVDATVVGITYKCGTSTTVSGTTNANGEYTCQTGQAVAFYVGDILIGSVNSPLAVVTPLDLVGAGATPANTTVANIVRFLMSISSTDPATGTLTITPAVITAAAGKTVDFTAPTATAIDTLISTLKPGATVYSSAQATTHVTSSINGLFAGDYTGTYSGAMSGTWVVTIAANGTVSGTADGSALVSGTMATTLSTGSTYGFTGTAGGTPWVGTLNISTKVFSGTWNNGAGSSGTWTGTTSTGGGTGSSTPTVTGYAPSAGAAGTIVTINGTNLGLGFQPAPIVKVGTTTVTTPLTFNGQTSLSFAVPAGLVAGAYKITIGGATGTPITVGTFTVTAAGGGTGVTGLTFSPAFNGTSSFANSAPMVVGSILLYSQNSFQQQFSVTYFPQSGSTPESLVITTTSTSSSSTQAALVNQVTTANNMTNACTLTAHALLPACSNSGIAFNRTTGNISFTNTPMAINTGSTAPQPTAFTVNGTLSFTPF